MLEERLEAERDPYRRVQLLRRLDLIEDCDGEGEAWEGYVFWTDVVPGPAYRSQDLGDKTIYPIRIRGIAVGIYSTRNYFAPKRNGAHSLASLELEIHSEAHVAIVGPGGSVWTTRRFYHVDVIAKIVRQLVADFVNRARRGEVDLTKWMKVGE